MRKVYVVVQEGWDYNDEYYYRSESSGGQPKRAFERENDAESHCRALNIREVKVILSSGPEEIYCHLGEGETITSRLTERKYGTKISPEDSARLLTYFDVICDSYFSNDPVGISTSAQNEVPDEDWLLLGKYLNLNSYMMYPIPFGIG